MHACPEHLTGPTKFLLLGLLQYKFRLLESTHSETLTGVSEAAAPEASVSRSASRFSAAVGAMVVCSNTDMSVCRL